MDKLLPSERRPTSPLRPFVVPTRRDAGFSLIEICIAIAIVASAFIAILGLLPAGMRVYDSAASTTAQTRIVAHLTSMMQTGGYTKVLSQNRTPNMYYYDVDGSYLDSDNAPISGYETKRIYAARVLAMQQNIPNGLEKFNIDKTASKVIIAMGHDEDGVVKTLQGLSDEASISALKSGARVKTEAVFVARMDSEMDP